MRYLHMELSINESSPMLQIISPFLGAFFAFLFFLVAEAIKQKRERRKRNDTALEKLVFELNRHGSALSTTVQKIDLIMDVFGKSEHEKKPLLAMNRLHSISFNEELVESLRNEDLLNELFLYYERLKKCNRTINDINQSI